MFELRLEGTEPLGDLLDADAYREQLG
jgi:hypothetical protein